MYLQIYTVDLDNPDDCLAKFKSNTQLGAVMFIGIVLGTLLKSDPEEDKTIDSQQDWSRCCWSTYERTEVFVVEAQNAGLNSVLLKHRMQDWSLCC